MTQMVLLFVMNIKGVYVREMYHPEQIDYCVGWYVAQEDIMEVSCKMQDETISDFRLKWLKQES